MGFSPRFELCEGDIKTLDHIVRAEVEYFWITTTLLSGVSIDTSIVLE